MSAPATFDFETTLARLERIVVQIERDRLNIDEAIAQFEQGVHLVRTCQAELKRAEQRVRVLLEQNGKTTLTDYVLERREEKTEISESGD